MGHCYRPSCDHQPCQSVEDILTRHGVTDETDVWPEECLAELYVRYVDEMPYGVAKGRTGDPDVWVRERACREMGW